MLKLLIVIAVTALTVVVSGGSASADPSLPLPRMPICGDQDGSESPLVLSCPDFVPLPDVQTFQVPGTDAVDLRFDFIFREAILNNELGFFQVDDAAGSIGGLSPGDPGYLASAFDRATIIFPSGSTAFTPDATFPLNGGDILLFFLIQNNTLANLVANNPDNDLGTSPRAFFSRDSLNPDSVDHFVGFENTISNYTQFGFEDLTGGGDVDYDDVVYNIAPPLQPLTGQISLSPLNAALETGAAHTLTTLARTLGGTPLADVLVNFSATGANPTNGTDTTDASGEATFTYVGTNEGQDTINATATILGEVVTSNTAFAEWTTPDLCNFDHLSIRADLVGFPFQVAVSNERCNPADGSITADITITPTADVPYAISTTSVGAVGNWFDNVGHLLYWPQFPSINVTSVTVAPGGHVLFEARKFGFGLGVQTGDTTLMMIGHLAFLVGKELGIDPPQSTFDQVANLAQALSFLPINGGWVFSLVTLAHEIESRDVPGALGSISDLASDVPKVPVTVAKFLKKLDATSKVTTKVVKDALTITELLINLPKVVTTVSALIFSPREQNLQIINANSAP